MSGPVTLAFSPDGSRAALTIFHPKGNIVTAGMVAALRSALDSLADEVHLKLITLEGAGPDFSFGASIPEHTANEIGGVLPEMHALIVDLLEATAPTAAVVRGRCFGGGFELALACDFIFADRGATFALPEIKLGVFPPAASALLPPRVGYAPATRAILTGEVLEATEWCTRGLIEMVADDGELAAAVDRWFAGHLAPKSAAALRHAAAAARMGLVAHVRERTAATRAAILERPDAHPRRVRRDRRVHVQAHALVDGPLTMTFEVEIVLRERNFAVTEQLQHPTAPATWTDRDVEAVLKAILLAIDRAKNPAAADRYVALRGFSWIVEPADGGVVIAIEIPMGAAVAGPFDIAPARLDAMITRVLAAARPKAVVH